MRVLSIAFAEIPVGAPVSGGAEHILSILDAGLTARGHQSIVIAASGSRVTGRLFESSDHNETIGSVLSAQPVDVIHFHGLDFHRYLPATGAPMLATLHLPISYYPARMIEDCLSRGITLSCVSQNQAESCAASRRLAVIPNGIATETYIPEEPEAYLLWLGRICPEKGTHLALQVAHRLHVPLAIAGPVHSYPDHRRYFAHCIEPLLDDDRTYCGAVEADRKRHLMARARCLLVTSLVAETSSLVAMEALSCGTPVIAFRRGALPEIVEHGRTGFIVDSPQEMAQAVAAVGGLSRPLCRSQARRRFDSRRMIEDYLSHYQRIVTRRNSSGEASHENR